MKIAIGSDHGGFRAKEKIIDALSKEYEILDCGTYSEDSSNYALFGIKVASEVSSNNAELGIVICSSGIGISIAANKVKNIRCALLYNDEVAHLAKEHNNANVIAFGAKFMSYEEIMSRINIFLNSKFEEGRHKERIETIKNFENK